jgi:toxin CcdB
VAQFDAFANPNEAQRVAFPYLVVLQSDQLSSHTTRLVMPLARLPRPPSAMPRRLSQSVDVDGETLFPAAHLCAAVPLKVLRGRAVPLREQADVLRDALDAVIGGV